MERKVSDYDGYKENFSEGAWDIFDIYGVVRYYLHDSSNGIGAVDISQAGKWEYHRSGWEKVWK